MLFTTFSTLGGHLQPLKADKWYAREQAPSFLHPLLELREQTQATHTLLIARKIPGLDCVIFPAATFAP